MVEMSVRLGIKSRGLERAQKKGARAARPPSNRSATGKTLTGKTLTGKTWLAHARGWSLDQFPEP